jgi:hypothetical protein
MQTISSICNVWTKRPEGTGRCHMGDVGVNGRIILERNVKKLGIRM